MKGCDAKYKMNLEHKIILDGKLDHNHGPEDGRMLQSRKLKSDCKQKVEIYFIWLMEREYLGIPEYLRKKSLNSLICIVKIHSVLFFSTADFPRNTF